jgi:hypothetical protein
MKNEMPNLKQKVVLYKCRQSEACFSSYDLLTVKENTQNVHAEFTCMHYE